MKRNIATRLILSSLFILAIALSCFFAFTTYMLNKQVYDTTVEQLKLENKYFLRNMIVEANSKLPAQMKNESKSQHVVYAVDTETGRLIGSEYSKKGLGQRNQKVFLEAFENLTDEPVVMMMNDQKYIALSSSIPYETLDDALTKTYYTELFAPMQASRFTDATTIKITSMLPYQEVITVTQSNVLAFAMLLIVLFVLAGLMIRQEAKRITEPIVKLSQITKQYANRCFDTKLKIETGDELEELSGSIEQMVTSLVGYEKAQGELFRKLSHDLKTPLTAISGCAEGIENGYYKDQREPLRIIQEESMRMKHILEDLIFLTKMDANAENFIFEQYELTELVGMAAEKVESIAIMQDIDIIYEPSDKIYLQGDPSKLMRALINVLGNALKHTKDTVWIEVEVKDDYVHISVGDNGNGFEEAVLHKLFKRATGEGIDGSGIGLLIVHEVIRRHGGQVQATNVNEGGAQVGIILPKTHST